MDMILLTQLYRYFLSHNVDKPEMGVKSLWDLLTPLGRPVLYGSSFSVRCEEILRE